MKKYLILIALVILGVICVGAVSAADVTVDGLTFHMIDGFVEESADSANGIPMRQALNVYAKGDEKIYIKTMASSAENFDIDQETFDGAFEDLDVEPKTINGHKGYYNETEDGEYAFSYLKDARIVTITVPDEAYLEKIII